MVLPLGLNSLGFRCEYTWLVKRSNLLPITFVSIWTFLDLNRFYFAYLAPSLPLYLYVSAIPLYTGFFLHTNLPRAQRSSGYQIRLLSQSVRLLNVTGSAVYTDIFQQLCWGVLVVDVFKSMYIRARGAILMIWTFSQTFSAAGNHKQLWMGWETCIIWRCNINT